MYRPLILLLAFFASMPFCAEARNEFRRQEITIGDGLTQNSVQSITRDSKGFLWIGTRFGLNRYDLGNIRNYYATPGKDGGLPRNEVVDIFEDAAGQLWVACERGTAIYDRSTDTFKEILDGDRSVDIRCHYSNDKELLLGGAGIIYRYDIATQTLTRLRTKGGSTKYYTGIHPLPDGNFLLISRWGGAWIMRHPNGEISPFQGISSQEITASHIDRLGRIWISPYGAGLQCYDPRGNLLLTVNSDNSALGNDIILDITPGNEPDELWLATDGAGIHRLNTTSLKVTPLVTGGAQSVQALSKDSFGNLYAGTASEGAELIYKVAMQTLPIIPGSNGKRFSVISILEESDGSRIWFGTDGEGIVELDRRTGNCRQLPQTAGLKVPSMEHFDSRHIILSTFGGSFLLLDRQTGNISPAPQVFEEIRSIALKGLSLNLKKISERKIAVIDNELHIVDLDKGTFHTPVSRIEMPVKSAIYPFYTDDRQLLCVGSNYLMRYDIVHDSPVILHTTKEGEEIATAQYDGKGLIYLGGAHGISIYNLHTGTLDKFDAFGAFDINPTITSLLLDGDKLWIGAGNALFVRMLKEGTTLEFTQFDGVEPNELRNLVGLAEHDAIYLGGINGLLVIDRNQFNNARSYRSDITVELSEIEIDGRNSTTLLKANGTIRIPRSHHTIDIRFSDTESNPMRRKHYRFYINDGNRISTIDADNHTLRLSMLAGGTDYDISVACTKPDGSWTDPVNIVRLQVAGPVWRSWWAILIYVLIIAAIARVGYNVRKRHNRENERETENRRLNKELGFLVNINHELRTPLTLVYAPLKQLITRMEQQGTDPATIDELKGVYRNTKKMRDVINMSLQLWRTEASTPTVQLSEHNVGQWLDGILREFDEAAKANGIKLKAERNGHIGKAVFDIQRMNIAINNLIVHAIRHAETGTTVEIRLASATLETGRRGFSITVCSTGSRISEQECEGLFSKYYSDDNAPFGSGLGLPYVKLMTDILGGTIAADTENEGKSLTIRMVLPMEPTIETTILQPEEKPDLQNSIPATIRQNEKETSPVDMSDLTAMIVEEDMELNHFITANLTPYFNKVTTYVAFSEAAANLRNANTNPDIIITSILQLGREVKESARLRHIPVILLSSGIGEVDKEAVYSTGIDSYIAKPFDIEVLLSRSRNLLYSRQIIKDRYIGESLPLKIAEPPKDNASETFLLRINKIIEDHISQPEFSVDMIVKEMLISRSSLYTRFREMTGGLSIGSYISDYRMRRAKELLSTTNLPISEISVMLGFSSQRYFSSTFKTKTGQTPSAFRATAHENDENAGDTTTATEPTQQQ